MNLDLEKDIALKEVANVTEQEKALVEKANEKMASISKIKTIKKDGIVTRKRTKKSYSNIWKIFLSVEEEFKKYMGYGKDEIEKVGINNFIDFMDWSCEDDILKYKSDRVKALPCVHCGKAMTTFQLDFGLCESCKQLYNIDKLSRVLTEEDKVNPGSSLGTITAFVYIDEFRKMYYKEEKIENVMLDAYTYDFISGPFTRDLLVDRIIGNPLYEETFFKIGEQVIEHLEAKSLIQNKVESLKAIIESEDSIESKKKRVCNIYQ